MFNLFNSILHRKNKDNKYAFGLPLYKNFPIKPYINSHRTKRELQTLLEDLESNPAAGVRKEDMTFHAKDNLLRGEVVLLWWVKKVHRDDKPKYFEYRYGINFYESYEKLSKLGFISENAVTPSGDLMLEKYSDDIFRHKNGGFTEQETDKNFEDYLSQIKNHAKWLKHSGMKNEANEVIDVIKSERENHENFKLFLNAEQFSKQNKLQQSNDILLSLISEHHANFTADIFWRLAINYRKQKDYQSEIKAIQRFISDYQPEYGGDMWLDKFLPRLEKAESLLDKQKNTR